MSEADAEALVPSQREKDRQAGIAWAKQQTEPPTRAQAIEESDRRYPPSHPDFILTYNLSGGFLDGAASVNPKE